jgi:hypothetical protein
VSWDLYCHSGAVCVPCLPETCPYRNEPPALRSEFPHTTCDDGGCADWNYTSNTNQMIRAALCAVERNPHAVDLWPAGFNGMSGILAARLLTGVVRELVDDIDGCYEVMNPPNGWGARLSLAGVLQEIVEHLLEHGEEPTHVHISW